MNYLKKGRKKKKGNICNVSFINHENPFFFFFCISDSSKELLIGHSGVRNDVQEIPAVFESFAAVPSARAL